MTDDFSMVPRDLAGRLEGLDAADGNRYERLVEEVRSLPARKRLPPCRACGGSLTVETVFLTDSGTAIALRLTCDRTADHEAGRELTYVYEVVTRELYPERRRVPDDEESDLTLSVAAFRRDLERAADGEPVETILQDRLEGS